MPIAPTSDPAVESPERSNGMIDSFGRRITYVRMSVTDRCDLRCRYCMPQNMKFLPRREVMTLEEIARLAELFAGRGVRRIRLTGGEPLVRRGIVELAEAIGSKVGSGLDELTLTTNGTQLERFASSLHAAGMRRINVSVDSLCPDRFAHITRGGDLSAVLRGLEAARSTGLAIKINMVALAGINEGEIGEMVRWCAGQGHDLTLIETMPLGSIEEDRTDRYLPLDQVRSLLAREFELLPSVIRTGGPARYFDLAGSGIRIGFITPLTDNFCDGCNRIRVSASGTVYGCLGHEQNVDLRDALRSGGREEVDSLLDRLLAGKPRRHDFVIGPSAAPAVDRHMSVTGG